MERHGIPAVIIATDTFVQFARRMATTQGCPHVAIAETDRKSTRLNSSHVEISYAVFCLKKKKKQKTSHHLLLHTAPDYSAIRPMSSPIVRAVAPDTLELLAMQYQPAMLSILVTISIRD